MNLFARTFLALETSNKTNDKLNALVEYFRQAPDKDKVWVVALFTGKRPRRPVPTALMRQWAQEITQIPDWLFAESYGHVGDLGETLSLILPAPEEVVDKPLHRWIEEIDSLRNLPDAAKKDYVIDAWMHLPHLQRFIFNKLIGGGFRVGVSGKMLVNALSRYSGNEPTTIMHAIMGKWSPWDTPFEDLLSAPHADGDLSRPYPFCLAYPLEKTAAELGAPEEWQAEWKWDGIRGQIIHRGGEIFIWSRGEELVTAQFPELQVAAMTLPAGTVIDGEILVVNEGMVQPFSQLQQRLNRKTISKKMLADLPVAFYAYDLPEWQGNDIRHLPLHQRRAQLEALIARLPAGPLHLSPIVPFQNWEQLAELRQQSRQHNSEGLMLKALPSPYHSGRKKGDWWKWKVDPLSIDAVLIYAQRGSGRRSGLYTDYTFAIRHGDALITIAKAYSGLTDQEIKEVDRFVKQNSLEKFGPVRTVKPELVFEIGFEGIAASKRHKSGIALRFPRILRWRKDKPAHEATTLEEVTGLLNQFG